MVKFNCIPILNTQKLAFIPSLISIRPLARRQVSCQYPYGKCANLCYFYLNNLNKSKILNVVWR